ncbi:MAG TPA: hypothetical protein VM077_02460 [Candidatus Limnocylindrales bacterium]|nr:hypothetical protein [Candidatus Limnocylindrales bacterium]
MEKKDQKSKTPIMHSFKDGKSSFSPNKVLIIFVILFLLGAGTGYGLSNSTGKTGRNTPLASKEGSITNGKTFGSDDTKTFKDTAEGKLEEGGIEGEGQYHLVRSEDVSQHVYMTSSTVDLSQFIGKKIKVWGQTQTAQKAGWLMDVGRVEVK